MPFPVFPTLNKAEEQCPNWTPRLVDAANVPHATGPCGPAFARVVSDLGFREGGVGPEAVGALWEWREVDRIFSQSRPLIGKGLFFIYLIVFSIYVGMGTINNILGSVTLICVISVSSPPNWGLKANIYFLSLSSLMMITMMMPCTLHQVRHFLKLRLGRGSSGGS